MSEARGHLRVHLARSKITRSSGHSGVICSNSATRPKASTVRVVRSGASTRNLQDGRTDRTCDGFTYNVPGDRSTVNVCQISVYLII